MKSILVFLLTILLQLNVYAQAPIIQWEKSFGGSLEDTGLDIKLTTDGGYIMVGATMSSDAIPMGNHHGNYDIYVVKTSSSGIVEWQKTIGGTSNDFGISISQTLDNGYIISGYTSSNDGDITANYGLYDCLVIKLDNMGNIQWRSTYGGSKIDVVYDIIQTNDGGYIFTATSRSSDVQVSTNHGGDDVWIVKLDALGSIEWDKSIGGSDHDIFTTIFRTADDGYILVGYSFSSDGDLVQNQGICDAWILKLNSVGIIEWQKTYGGSDAEYLYDIQQTPDGGYITCGKTKSINGNLSNNYGNSDAWIIKLSSVGEIEWSKTYGGSSDEGFRKIIATQDGKFVLGGNTYSNDFDVTANYGESDCWLLKITNNGDIVWNKSFGGSLFEGISGLIPTSDGGSIFVGSTFSSDFNVSENFGIYDMWMVKLSPEWLSNETFEHVSLDVFPNPTTNLLNLQTVDNFFIDTVKVTDIAGKTVMSQSENTNQIKTQDLSQGIYFLQATSKNKTYQTKFIKQ